MTLTILTPSFLLGRYAPRWFDYGDPKPFGGENPFRTVLYGAVCNLADLLLELLVFTAVSWQRPDTIPVLH
jgi:hypothetical protein